MTQLKRNALGAALALLGLGLGSDALALEQAVEIAKDGCKVELEKYCKDVTPGGERLLQCLSAHEDKLSGRCVYMLHKASRRVEDFMLAAKHLTTECATDIHDKCGGAKIGEGVIAPCLKKNLGTISLQCRQAMKDTEMDTVEE